MPGAFASGTDHFANASKPADQPRAGTYASDWPERFIERVLEALADAESTEVARAVTTIVRYLGVDIEDALALAARTELGRLASWSWG